MKIKNKSVEQRNKKINISIDPFTNSSVNNYNSNIHTEDNYNTETNKENNLLKKKKTPKFPICSKFEKHNIKLEKNPEDNNNENDLICLICKKTCKKPLMCPNCHKLCCEQCIKNKKKKSKFCSYCNYYLFDASKYIEIKNANNYKKNLNKKEKEITEESKNLSEKKHRTYNYKKKNELNIKKNY